MNREKNNPILYVLLRNDMASMDVGRMTVAASHATSKFLGDAIFNGINVVSTPASPFRLFGSRLLKSMLSRWAGAALVGNTVTVEANGAQIESLPKTILSWAEYVMHRKDNANPPFMAAHGLVYDDCYPVRDGDVVHFPKTLIGGYVFGIRGELEHVMARAPLVDHMSPWMAKERLMQDIAKENTYEALIEGLSKGEEIGDIELP